jgi:hypothetical protein
MDVRKLGFGLVLALALAVPAEATPLPRYGAFVFSGLCTDLHTGRMIGSRLTLVRQDRSDFVYYEWSDLFTPGDSRKAFGTNVVVGLQGAAAIDSHITTDGHISSDLSPDHKDARVVSGELSAEGFTLSGFEARIWLPRQRDLGAKIPVCDFRPPKLPKQ